MTPQEWRGANRDFRKNSAGAKKEYVVADVLETWKEHGDCRHGSGERYVRKHGYRVLTAGGAVLRLYFQRSQGRGKLPSKSRWWVHSIEGCAGDVPPAD